MKYIIEMPEHMIKSFQEMIEHTDFKTFNINAHRSIIENFANGKPLEHELKEIKAEIVNLDYDKYSSLPEPAYVLEDVIWILEKHIKELNNE